MFTAAIACYLFLGGLGSGVLFLLCLVRGAKALPRWSASPLASLLDRVVDAGLLLSFSCLSLGALCLLADMGHPERFLLVFLNFSFAVINVGALSLALSALFSLGWWLYRQQGRAGRGKPGAAGFTALAVCALASFTTMLYTGLLLESMYAVPFWGNLLIAPLFVLSSLSCALAALLLLVRFVPTRRRTAAVEWVLLKADAAAIAAELLVVVLYLALSLPEGKAREALSSMLFGGEWWLFWIGFAACGVLVPLVAEVFCLRSQRRGAPVALNWCVLAGGFFLRLCFVNASVFR